MEKSEVYTFKDENSTLQFSFPMGEKNRAQKASFLKHLQEAVKTLSKEFEQDPK